MSPLHEIQAHDCKHLFLTDHVQEIISDIQSIQNSLNANGWSLEQNTTKICRLNEVKRNFNFSDEQKEAVQKAFTELLVTICTTEANHDWPPTIMEEFDTPTKEQAFITLTEQNPLLLYEKWQQIDCCQKLHMEQGFLHSLKQHIPFFELEEEIQRLNHNTSIAFETIRDAFEAVLHRIHEINKKCGIPPHFYTVSSSESKNSLSLFITERTKHAGPQEILGLLSLLHKNYFCGTNALLHDLFVHAKEKYPLIERLLTSYPMGNIKNIDTPFLTPEGATHIVQNILRKKSFEDLFFPPVFHIDQLSMHLSSFATSDKTKGVFLFTFSHDPSHFSPLIAEKEEYSINIFSSDSIYKGIQRPFTKMILEKIDLLPFKKELYVFPKTRQHDMFSCPLFAINDIAAAVGIMKRDSLGSFFHSLLQSTDVTSGYVGTIPVHKVHKLPANMLKLTQSSSQIKKAEQSADSVKKISLQSFITNNSFFVYNQRRRTHDLMNLSAAQMGALSVYHLFEECLR